MVISILTLSYFINITRIIFSLVIVPGLSTFWSLVNLLTAVQIHWNEGRSLAFSAQHSVRTENLKIAQFINAFSHQKQGVASKRTIQLI